MLRKVLYEADCIDELSEWPPHITIAAYEDVNIDELLKWTEDFSHRHNAFEISLSSLGIFPPFSENAKTATVYASPSQSKSLIDFYYAFHEKLDNYHGKLGWFYSSEWGYPIIHSTIGAVKLSQLQKAMEKIFENFYQGFARSFGITKIVALEVYTYPMELVMRYDL